MCVKIARSAFSAPAAFTFGNAGRNTIPGPGNNLFDIGLQRRFRIREGHSIQLRAESFNVWSEPMVTLRVPKIFNLRSDPFERADHNAIYYNDWLVRRVFLLVPAQGFVAQWISSFKEYPPSQTPASFNLDGVMEKLKQAHSTGR